MTNGTDRVADAPAHRRASRSVRDLPAAERPRERLALRGPSGLSAAELIAVVWGTGGGGRSAVELAEEALARHGGVAALGRAGVAELAAIPAVGPAKAGRLAAAFELGRRSLADWPVGRWTIRSPRDVAVRLLPEMGRLEREELRVLSLNAKNVVQRVSTSTWATSRRPWSGSASCSGMPCASTHRAWSSCTTTRRATRRPRQRTSTSPPRRSPPAGSLTSTCWITS